MKPTRQYSARVEELQRLVRKAWLDLKQARRDEDLDRMLVAEQRMNVLLDQLATSMKRMPTHIKAPHSHGELQPTPRQQSR
jgi:hypothetical protein